MEFYPKGRVGSYSIPSGVQKIADGAFYECFNFAQITIPKSVSSIGAFAFGYCYRLDWMFFLGDAPTELGWYTIFDDTFFPKVCFLPNTSGWDLFYPGFDMFKFLWNPRIENDDGSFGLRTNGFGFNVSGTPGIPIVLESSATLNQYSWTPLQSCTLTNGLLNFSDPLWTNYSSRFYRVRTP